MVTSSLSSNTTIAYRTSVNRINFDIYKMVTIATPAVKRSMIDVHPNLQEYTQVSDIIN